MYIDMHMHTCIILYCACACVNSWWWLSPIFSSLCSLPLPTPSRSLLECSSQFSSSVGALYTSSNSGVFTFGYCCFVFCCCYFIIVIVYDADYVMFFYHCYFIFTVVYDADHVLVVVIL